LPQSPPDEEEEEEEADVSQAKGKRGTEEVDSSEDERKPQASRASDGPSVAEASGDQAEDGATDTKKRRKVT
jgi:hypothetical protein